MMNEKKMEAINTAYKATTCGQDEFNLNIRRSLKGTSVFKDNWEICDLSDLSIMIEELIQLRDTIETETGIKF